ncbi:hypothetical protein HDU97_003450 [Phlyctochytrium planicorne]|nr:hypothetical protein HDU97_003450 [Phlyctochytrium planicorne]
MTAGTHQIVTNKLNEEYIFKVSEDALEKTLDSGYAILWNSSAYHRGSKLEMQECCGRCKCSYATLDKLKTKINLQEPAPLSPQDLSLQLRNDQPLSDFSKYWRLGRPAVCRSRLGLEQDWSPTYFETNFGNEKLNLHERISVRKGPGDLKTVFAGLKDLKMRKRDALARPLILQLLVTLLKDVLFGLAKHPHTFQSQFPAHHQDLLTSLENCQLSTYFSPSGSGNLRSRQLPNPSTTHFAPKLQVLYESQDKPPLGVGSLPLTFQTTDHASLMVHASSLNDKASDKNLPSTVWDVFHHTDAEKVRGFATKVAGERGVVDAPVFLDEEMRKRMVEEIGVAGWRIKQNVGDAVVLPAGCVWQVTWDLSSPETALQSLNLQRTSKQRALGISSMLFQAFKNSPIFTSADIRGTRAFISETSQKVTVNTTASTATSPEEVPTDEEDFQDS